MDLRQLDTGRICCYLPVFIGHSQVPYSDVTLIYCLVADARGMAISRLD